MDRQIRYRNQLSFFEPFLVVIFWILLFASPFFLGNYENGFNWTHIFRVWTSLVPYLIIFLINRFVLLPYLFLKKQRVLFTIVATLIIVLMTFGMYIFREDFFPQFNRAQQEVVLNELGIPQAQMPLDRPGEARPDERPRHPRPNERSGPAVHPNRPERPPKQSDIIGPPPGRPGAARPPRELPPFISFFVISVLIVGFDTGLILSVKWVQSERKRASEEKEHMQTQLAFLRNQVSPHFFMNTLNNIHSLIDYDSDEAKESIIRLSKLMRHLLYDSEAEQIPIQKEIDFIRNYVDLMRLRFSDKIEIELVIPPQLPDKLIPPLLFTSFVENAFKHGVSYQKSMFINISFQYNDDGLHFHVRNSHTGSKSEKDYSGIGIANSRKRLDLLYGDQYKLDIENKEEEFIVDLIIPV